VREAAVSLASIVHLSRTVPRRLGRELPRPALRQPAHPRVPHAGVRPEAVHRVLTGAEPVSLSGHQGRKIELTDQRRRAPGPRTVPSVRQGGPDRVRPRARRNAFRSRRLVAHDAHAQPVHHRLGQHRECVELERVLRGLRRRHAAASIRVARDGAEGVPRDFRARPASFRSASVIAVASVDPAAASRSFSEAQWPTRRLPIALVLLMCVIALARNYAIVREFDWPGFDIEFREMAAAQTLLDEGFGPDSSYQGERIWYNPLPAGVAAIGSRVTGVPLHKFIVRVGPWLNLLAPLALFWLVAVLFDAWCGVAATAAFLFMTGTNLPFYYSATYSPWFAPENFGQAPFYVALLPLSRSFNAPSSGWRD